VVIRVAAAPMLREFAQSNESEILWRCSWLYQRKNPCPKARPSPSDPNRSGKLGLYLSVLNRASENGLSLETCGRLCVLVTACLSCRAPESTQLDEGFEARVRP
jgi:hypothetical protein